MSRLHAAALRAHGRDAESVFGEKRARGETHSEENVIFRKTWDAYMVPMISHHGD